MGSRVLFRYEEKRRDHDFHRRDCDQSFQSRRRAVIAFSTDPIAGSGSDHPGREFTAGCGLN